MCENPVREAIQDAISDHEVILFMKGTPERPMCGFSARTAAALEALGTEYAAVDVLPDPRIRQELSAYPTGRRSPSCSSRASWSAAATSSPRCTSPASSPRRWRRARRPRGAAAASRARRPPLTMTTGAN